MKTTVLSLSIGVLVSGSAFSTVYAQNPPHRPLLSPRQADAQDIPSAVPTASPAAPAPVAPVVPVPPPPPASAPVAAAVDHSPMTKSLFDGSTLDGWIDQENNAATFSAGDIKDFPGFAKKLLDKTDDVSVFLNRHLDETLKAQLADYSPAATNAKSIRSALVKSLNNTIATTPVYDEARFKQVALRAETEQLLKENPAGGQKRVRLNKLLVEDAYPELAKSPASGWIVKDGAIASTGVGRGTLYTKDDYGHFRLTFLMRHVSGSPDHQACVLIFCTRPEAGEKPLDALGGIQFQVPNGGQWDYRPGHNNGAGSEFANLLKPGLNVHEWSQVEIVANAETGTARMAVVQPPGGKAVEVLDFKDVSAGKAGPIALQMHNGGLFDEYKDLKIEVNPPSDDLMITR